MTAQISIYGGLGGTPRAIDTSSGKPMTVASVAVDVGERNVEDPAPEWFGVVAFATQAEKLLQHAKGECVSVSGLVQRNRWTDREGNEREQLQVIVDAVVGARTVRPAAVAASRAPRRPAAPATAERLSPRPLVGISMVKSRSNDAGSEAVAAHALDRCLVLATGLQLRPNGVTGCYVDRTGGAWPAGCGAMTGLGVETGCYEIILDGP